MVRIAQASADEKGRYTYGQAGDQTGSELNIRTWYNRPWDTVLRPIDAALGAKIASVAQILVKSNRIGYDQYQRTTAYDQCAAIGWDIGRINEIKLCECDCSSLIAVILGFCGIAIPKTVYTGNLSASVMATGKFLCLRDPKYLTGDQWLRKGDFVLNTAHHVATVLDNGAAAVTQFVPYIATVVVKTHLKVRTGPSTNFPEFMIDGGDGTWTPWRLPPETQVVISEERAGWGRIGNTIGWISLEYAKR